MLDKFFKTIGKIVPAKYQWVLTHDGFRRYFKNTGWMFLGRIFNLVIAFFIGVYIARYLGPTDYGLLNYSMSFAGLFAFLANLGIDGIISRELIRQPEKKNKLLGTGFYIKIVGSIATILMIFVFSLISRNNFFTTILILLFSLTYIFQAFNVIDLYFQSQVISKNTVKIQLISASLSTVMKLFVIFFGLGVVWLILIYLAESIIVAVGLTISFKKNNLLLSNWKFDGSLARKILANSWPLMLSSVAVSIYMRIDQVMIKQMIDETAVGFYSVAVKLSEIWYIIPSVVCASVLPAIVNAKSSDELTYNNRLKKAYFFMFWLAIAIALPLSLMAKLIISMLFGSSYLPAVNAFRISIWTTVPFFWGAFVGQYLLIENYVKISFFNTLTAALLNIGLNLILIPKYNIDGAALASFISYFSIIFLILFFKKTRSHFILIIKGTFNFK